MSSVSCQFLALCSNHLEWNIQIGDFRHPASAKSGPFSSPSCLLGAPHSLSHLGLFAATFVSLGSRDKKTPGKSSVNDEINAWIAPELWEKTGEEQKRPCWPRVLFRAPLGAEGLIHKFRPKSAEASVSLATTGTQMGRIRA